MRKSRTRHLLEWQERQGRRERRQGKGTNSEFQHVGPMGHRRRRLARPGLGIARIPRLGNPSMASFDGGYYRVLASLNEAPAKSETPEGAASGAMHFPPGLEEDEEECIEAPKTEEGWMRPEKKSQRKARIAPSPKFAPPPCQDACSMGKGATRRVDSAIVEEEFDDASSWASENYDPKGLCIESCDEPLSEYEDAERQSSPLVDELGPKGSVPIEKYLPKNVAPNARPSDEESMPRLRLGEVNPKFEAVDSDSDFDGELVDSSGDEFDAGIIKATTSWQRRRVQRKAAKYHEEHAEDSTFELPLSGDGSAPILSGSSEYLPTGTDDGRQGTDKTDDASRQTLSRNPSIKITVSRKTKSDQVKWVTRQVNNKAISADEERTLSEFQKIARREGLAMQQAEAEKEKLSKKELTEASKDKDARQLDCGCGGSHQGDKSPEVVKAPWVARRGGWYSGIDVLTYADQESMSALDEEGWYEFEVTADSGAYNTVIPMSSCEHIRLHESVQSRSGMKYEAANKGQIENMGERRCIAVCEGSHVQSFMHFQVADVHKPLLSITRVADMGYECVLGKHGGYLLDTHSGERVPVKMRGNLYVMSIWVKDATSVGTNNG